MPIRDGIAARFVTFEGLSRPGEHFALCFGKAPSQKNLPLVRVHSECVTGDLFWSRRCDCGFQLNHAVDRLNREGGILLYLRQEGRGIGLLHKIDAYALQDRGLDTFEANLALGQPADARSYQCSAEMLRALGTTRIRLITNNPDKIHQLTNAGIEVVERVSAGFFVTAFNGRYLSAKADSAGHNFA
jgi:GTP cyclohydrolase II